MILHLFKVIHLLCALAGGLARGHTPLTDGHGLPTTPHPKSAVNVAAASLVWETAVRLDLNTSGPHVAGEWVEVRISGVIDPRYDDMIALYAPEDVDPRTVAPLKYKFLAAVPSYVERGEGTLSFRLLNLRQPQRFYFLRDGLALPVFAAHSRAVAPLDPGEPTQVHLALTGRPSEVKVLWVSGPVDRPLIRWGADPQYLDREAPADSTTYTREAMCGAPANSTGWLDPGALHSVVLGDLAPGRRYFYTVGSRGGAWSEVASFLGPPGPDAEVHILAMADLGQTEVDGSVEVDAIAPASLLTSLRLAQEAAGATLMVLNGDLSYARGYAVQWETFFDQLAPMLRALPLMTVIGNHERDWPGSGDRFGMAYDSGGECGVPYAARTGMPTAGPDRPWYSFDHGPIHFLQYSTEHAFEEGSPQHAFIADDLAAVDRCQTPWVILGGHRPMYIDSTFDAVRPDGDQYLAAELRRALEPLLLRHGVDATWHGHHHSYQRTCPLAGGRCLASGEDGVAAGPVHIVLGHSGASLTPNTEPQRPREFVSVQLQHGYVRVTANATRLEHVVVSSRDGSVMDRWVLEKPAGWCGSRGVLRQGEERVAAAWPSLEFKSQHRLRGCDTF
uniref:Purple acid phosphatase n=2 Tax=Auxenochlorella protothecoides TaxID=3075 RepID=A0A1D1ZXW6_AUXPR